MKQETKVLVQFIEDCIIRYQTEVWKGNVKLDAKEEDELCEKARAFLHSLPGIESHLCNGGFIQDKNGTPCCHGDNLKCVLVDTPEDNWFYGKLTWRGEAGTFIVLTQTKTLYLTEINWFEKVE